jgi:hypothetical protein
MYDRITLVFCLSYNNPFTGKKMRAYRKDGINGFIHEVYTDKNAKHNKFIADHCIAYCENCEGQHSIFGMGKTPSEAYNECVKELAIFKCDGVKGSTN